MNSSKYDLNFNLNELNNRPVLDIAAGFWDDDRYHAFKFCYRSMRWIDDLVDDRKILADGLSGQEKAYYINLIKKWVSALIHKMPYDSMQKELVDTLAQYHIPNRPWIEFSKPMNYDIQYDGFQSFPAFLRYSRGAAIAPGAIFMHLCGIKKNKWQILGAGF